MKNCTHPPELLFRLDRFYSHLIHVPRAFQRAKCLSERIIFRIKGVQRNDTHVLYPVTFSSRLTAFDVMKQN